MIALDLDGTVLDTQLRHYHCYRTVAEDAGLEPLAQERYWQAKRQGVPLSDLLADPRSGAVDERVLATWLDLIEADESLELDRIQAGAIEVLEEWRRQRVFTTLVTSRQSEPALSRQLDRFGLTPLLDQVVCASGAHTGALKAAALREQVNDRQFQLWIGDTEVDIDAARRVGASAVAVSSGLRSVEVLAKYDPWLLASDLAEVAVHPAIAAKLRLPTDTMRPAG